MGRPVAEKHDDELSRFRDGYRRSFDQALSEIALGRKRSHWMWFIFPQVTGLGSSPNGGALRHYEPCRSRSVPHRHRPLPFLPATRRRSLEAGRRQRCHGPRSVRPPRRPEAGVVTHPVRRRRRRPRRRVGADHDEGQRHPRRGRPAGPGALRDHAALPSSRLSVQPVPTTSNVASVPPARNGPNGYGSLRPRTTRTASPYTMAATRPTTAPAATVAKLT